MTGPDAPSALENFLDLHVRKVVVGLAVLVVVLAAATAWHLNGKKFEREAGSALVAAKDLDSLRKVVADYGNTPAGQTARLLLAGKQSAGGDAKGAAETLRAFLEANKEHPLASQARIALADALLSQGQTDEAAAELSAFLSASPSSPLAPLAMILQAEILEKNGDDEGARKIYSEVKSGFPESRFLSKASQRLDRVGFVMPTEVEPPPPPPPAPESGAPTPGVPGNGAASPLLDGEGPLPIPGTEPAAGSVLPPPPAPETAPEPPAVDSAPADPTEGAESPVPEARN